MAFFVFLLLLIEKRTFFAEKIEVNIPTIWFLSIRKAERKNFLLHAAKFPIPKKTDLILRPVQIPKKRWRNNVQPVNVREISNFTFVLS